MQFLRKKILVSGVLVAVIILLLSEFVSGQGKTDQECFMILVGKGASADGSIFLAHNNDLTGVEASHLVKFSGQEYNLTDSVTFPSGIKIPQIRQTFQWMALKILKGYAEGDAVAINEFGVAIAGGVALKPDRNSLAASADPLVDDGLTGGVRYIALQRAKTARQCVSMLGKMYTQYGVTYPSGVGIADTSEIWYIESGGGHCWAAVRVPDSCYWPQANGYRIGMVDPDDTTNYYCAPGLLQFCREHNLWNPAKGAFRFSEAFGGGRRERNEKPYYDTRRIWRCIDLLSPGLKMEPGLKRYPEYLKPDRKISLQDCFDILRDRYEGSEFESNVVDNGINGERPIASRNAVHTDVIQLYPGLPIACGAVLWVGIGAPISTFYVPCFYGIEEIPHALTSSSMDYDDSYLFWKFRKLSENTMQNGELLKMINDQQKVFESAVIESIPGILRQAQIRLGRQDESCRTFLESVSSGYLQEVILIVDSLNAVSDSRVFDKH